MHSRLSFSSVLLRAARLLTAGAALTAFALIAAAVEEQTWEAHITDEMCGSAHMMEGMTDPECARACQEMGAAYLLFVEAEDKLFQIADQEQVEDFAGTDVLVTGVLSEDGKTVTIHEITPR